MEQRELAGAYARGLYHALGVDGVEGVPLVGIANSWNELVPGHIHLDQVAEAVKTGVRDAGGIPLEFNTIALCDGICQGSGMHAISRRDLFREISGAYEVDHGFQRSGWSG